ncbi:MAG: EamA family transporter, partial [Fidelibacterota bacterium]
FHQGSMNATGTLLAILSGGLASGIGYTIWYFALRGLRTTSAAVAQLSVPVLAAIGGVLFMKEAITLRLTVASLLILGGIAIVVTRKSVKP